MLCYIYILVTTDHVSRLQSLSHQHDVVWLPSVFSSNIFLWQLFFFPWWFDCMNLSALLGLRPYHEILVFVRFLKLSNGKPFQWIDGRPLENTWCCKVFFLFSGISRSMCNLMLKSEYVVYNFIFIFLEIKWF